jgi:hypothetical protein
MLSAVKATPRCPVLVTVGTQAAIAAELVPTNSISQRYGGAGSGGGWAVAAPAWAACCSSSLVRAGVRQSAAYDRDHVAGEQPAEAVPLRRAGQAVFGTGDARGAFHVGRDKRAHETIAYGQRAKGARRRLD